MFRVSGLLLAATYIPAVTILAAIAIVSIATQIPIQAFTRDPSTIAGHHPFTGVLSNLGVLLWCSSAAMCLLSGSALHRVPRGAISWFLVSTGVLTLMFLFDDLFLFHDVLARRHLGLSAPGVFVVYAYLTVVYLVVFRRVILQTGPALLCFALIFFAIAITTDLIPIGWLRRLGNWRWFVEDASKFLGIASWCGYCTQISLKFLASNLGRAASPEA